MSASASKEHLEKRFEELGKAMEQQRQHHPKVKIHLELRSMMRDSYDSCHTVGRAAIDILASDTVEAFKCKALAALGEFAEIRDVHHTKCRFIAGPKLIASEDDAKTCAEIGLQNNVEVHVMLPIGHDSALATPSSSAAAAASSSSPVSSPSSPSRFKIHVHLKSVIRDAYDTVEPVAKAELEVLGGDSIESLKAKAFAALGEISELRDVRHTQCKFHVAGKGMLTAADDDKSVAQFGVKEGDEIHIVLPIGHDSVLVKS